jgi:hypothetical protein
MVLTLGPGEHSLRITGVYTFDYVICWIQVLTGYFFLVLKTKL